MNSELSNTLKKLRAQRGLSQQAVSDALGFSRSTLGNYEQGTRTPDLATMSLFADFYGVTIDYLQGRSSNPSLNHKDEIDISKNVEEMKESLENGSLRMSLDGEEITDEVKEFILDQIENTLTLAKIKSKEKFTPKKYK